MPNLINAAPLLTVCSRPVTANRPIIRLRHFHPCPAKTADMKDDVIGEVVPPSFVNKPWVRSVAALGTLWVASKYTTVPITYLRSLHFFSFAGWFGSTIWVIFLSPRLLFQTVTRQTFGKIQSKLFPQYFGFSAATLVTMMATSPSQSVPYTLIGAFFANAVNWLFLEPKISGLAARRYALENEETRDEEAIAVLKKTTGRFHGMSSVAALLGFLCGTAHGVNLSSFMSF